MATPAIQDLYPDDLAHCHGCGRLNVHGLHVQSRWDGDTTLAELLPRPEHTAIPGFVYGGLLASLIDCHGTGSAALASQRQRGDGSFERFVTAALQVDFLAPTPMGVPLRARGRIAEQTAKKVVVEITVTAAGTECARGRVVAVRMPASMRPGS